MLYEVCREHYFSAAHQLREYNGKCESLHGHNWRVRVCARASELDHLGMVIDFKKLKSSLNEILDRLDHHMLNEVEPFDRLNPTAENIASYIGKEIDRLVSDERVRVHRCEVWESDGSRATFFIESPCDD